MLSSFARQSIVRLRYPDVLDRGTARADYTATPDELPIAGCWLEPTEVQVVKDGRLAVLTGWTVAAPPGTDVRAADHVRYQDVEYEPTGPGMHVPSPTGALDSVKLTIYLWEG